MAIQVANFKTIGMQRDTSESAFDSKFAFENMNMRITAKDSNTFLSLTNEKGTQAITSTGITSIPGYPIGYCVLNDTLVLFTTLNTTDRSDIGHDTIYSITNTSTPNTVHIDQLFQGDLDFDVTHPIETIPFYENENIQKVYWTDGKNQMRFINIKETGGFTNKSFDYTPIMTLKEVVTVTKQNSGGTFPAGVIQYAFSYINDYGIESAIFHTTPLYYLSNISTGEPADGTVSNSFDILLTNLDSTFDKVRIYSITRTSVNGTPIIKKVVDLSVQAIVSYTATLNNTYTGFEGMVMTVFDINYIVFKDSNDNIISYADAFPSNQLLTNTQLGNIKLECTSPPDPMNISVEHGGVTNTINCDNFIITLIPSGTSVIAATTTNDNDILTLTSVGRLQIDIQNLDIVQNATYASNTMNTNVDVTITAKTIGSSGNDITFSIQDVDAGYESVNVVGNDISVYLTAQASTIGDLITLITNDIVADALITIICTQGTESDPLYQEIDPVALVGGLDLEYAPTITPDPSSTEEASLKFTNLTAYTHYGLITSGSLEVPISLVSLKGKTNISTDRVRVYGPFTLTRGLSNPVTTNHTISQFVEYCPHQMNYPTFEGGFQVLGNTTAQGNTQLNPVIKYYTNDAATSFGANITDTNALGETQTVTGLLYTGGEKIVAQTLTQKDNTLFLGNIELVKESAGDIQVGNTMIKDLIGTNNPANIVFSAKDLATSTTNAISNNTSHYPYESSRTLKSNDFAAKTFKYGEYYRFGIQFQHETGKWSEAIWITDAQNTLLPSTTKTGTTSFNIDIKGSKATYSMASLSYIVPSLVSAGYIRARGLVVYPNLNERRVIAQGILNPTVYQIKNRDTDKHILQSSWFLRPMKPAALDSDFGDSTTASMEGGFVEFRHNRALSGVIKHPGGVAINPQLSRGAEIENFMYSNTSLSGINIDYPLTPYVHHTGVIDPTRDTKAELVQNYADAFVVDQNAVTFNSPDLEFNEDLWNLEFEGTDINILGLTHLTGFVANNSVTPTDAYDPDCIGFVNLSIKKFNISVDNGLNVCAATPMWYDAKSPSGWANFVVFPWQATRPFININITDPGAPTMTSKHSSNLRFSAANTYFTPNSFAEHISVPKLFNSTEETILTIAPPTNSGLVDYNYQGNINQIINPVIGNGTIEGFQLFLTLPTTSLPAYQIDTQTKIMEDAVNVNHFTESVSMKYKSAPHLVFNFNWKTDGTQVILPALNGVNKAVAGRLFYKEDCVETIEQADINVSTTSTLGGGVWLADLIRPVNVNTIFGGKTQSAFENNMWEVAGVATSLVDSNGDPLLVPVIEFTAGDTYIQRHDCIRTYPYSVDDVQTMTEIVSFLCETRINLDARTDTNRGRTDNRFITPLNTNLLNDVYNQKDNYFVYRGLNYELFSLDKFSNTFTWTSKKITGELTDTWTNINMINTYDANGKYGPITALRAFNNELVGFQSKGLFKILYNSRVQVNASDGFPIEFANSGQVDGVRYISSNVGTSNKYSIVETPNGLYFIDDINKSINLISDQVINLSDKLGFRSWSKTNFTGLLPWNPVDYNNFTGHYDSINKDVYFVGKANGNVLCFSELLGQFTSFFNYEKTPYIVNLWDGLYSIRRDKDNTVTKLWKHNAGSYNQFYDNVNPSPFYTTLIVNPNPTLNKVFNTFEFRADSWSTANPKVLQRVVDFNKLIVWNEYQTGESTLTVINNKPSTLKEKFRAWRVWVPRVTSVNYSAGDGGTVNPSYQSGLDRLRGNWAYMKLWSAGTNNLETVLHDINVYYNV